MSLIRKILVPMDASECFGRGVARVRELARAGARVQRRCAARTCQHGDFKVGSAAPLAPEALRRAEQEMEEGISRAAGRLGDRLGRTTQSGDPLEADRGSRGRGRLRSHRHGDARSLGAPSHADGERRGSCRAERSPCPVLVVRIPERDCHSPSALRGRRIALGGSAAAITPLNTSFHPNLNQFAHAVAMLFRKTPSTARV